MSQILTLEGKPAGPAVTEAKSPHDPEETRKQAALLNNVYQQCMKGFAEDMNPEKAKGVVQMDFEAVRKHYADKWRAQAELTNSTAFPHKVDPEKVHNDITQGWEQHQRELAMHKPMEQVDLSHYELLPVGRISTGMLHLSDVCAVSVHEGGVCQVWVRQPHEALERWASGWMPKPQRSPMIECVQYTMAELHQLLTACRVARIATLSEQLMDTARKPVGINWWQKS